MVMFALDRACFASPGDIVGDILMDVGMSGVDFGARMGWSDDDVRDFWRGFRRIDSSDAARLADIIGSTADTWLRIDAAFVHGYAAGRA